MAGSEKEIIICFGEMGSGKSYWAKQIAKDLGYDFFEGDDAVPSEMAAKVSAFKFIPREMIEDFVWILSTHISHHTALSEKGLVVSQALYTNKDRLLLKSILEKHGYKITFYWIRTTFFKNLTQICHRPRGFRWALYWLMSKPWFEKPTHETIEWGGILEK